jgi:hypothetical protein
MAAANVADQLANHTFWIVELELLIGRRFLAARFAARARFGCA